MSKVIRKAFSGGAWVQKGDEGARLLSARVSTLDRDRDGEVVVPGGIDYSRYLSNPVLCWVHDLARPTIGKAIAINADARGLNCKFAFADTPFGNEIFSLYAGGYLSAWSIGFLPVEFDPKTKTHKRVELIEVSAVPVGSNPQALTTAIGKGLRVSKALMKDLGLKDEIDLDAIEGDVLSLPPDELAKVVAETIADAVEVGIAKVRGRVI